MKVMKLTIEIATVNECGSDDVWRAVFDMCADGKICYANIISEEVLFDGRHAVTKAAPAKRTPKARKAGVEKPADRPKRKYTRRAKVAKADQPVVVPKQPNGTERVIGSSVAADVTPVKVVMRT